MGCHTWFYKRIETPPYEEVQEFVVRLYENSINRMRMFLEIPTHPDWLMWKELYPEVGENNYLEKQLEIDERRLGIIKKGLCRDAVFNRYFEYTDGPLLLMHKGALYQEVEDFHDVFRKYGYPHIKLTSPGQTLLYIEDKSNECQTNEHTYKRLKQFWKKYPDGLIQFG